MTLPPTWPAMGENGLFIEKPSFQPSAHPCGECVEYSIYGACWREGGCGVDPCEYQPVVDVDTCNYDAPLKFVFTSTKIAKILYGPHAAPADGTLTTTTLIDHKIVAGPSSQEVLEDVEYTVEYVPEEDLCFTSGWHAIKVYAEWKDGEGVVIQSEQRTVCVYAAIRPAGEDAIQLHDVRILPGLAGEVCIDENLKFVRMLGPYRSHADADYVLERWGDTITTWAGKCLCPNTCVRAEGISGVGSTINTDLVNIDANVSIGSGKVAFTSCTPSDYPIYVDGRLTFDAAPGVSVILAVVDEASAYVSAFREWDDRFDGTIDFVVPPCTALRWFIKNTSGGSAGYNLSIRAAHWNEPIPEGYWTADPSVPLRAEQCPFGGDDLSNLVPATAEALREWIAENISEEE